jgi:hypothetical protein
MDAPGSAQDGGLMSAISKYIKLPHSFRNESIICVFDGKAVGRLVESGGPSA